MTSRRLQVVKVVISGQFSRSIKRENNILMDKQQLKEREARVIELATAFCKEHLDDECATA